MKGDLEYLGLKEWAIGKRLKTVEARAKKLGYRVRVTQRDGVSGLVTCDFLPMRLNVRVEKNNVIHVSRG